MDQNILFSLVFGLGVLAQILMLIRVKFKSGAFFKLFFISLLAFLPARDEITYEFYSHLFFMFIVFTVLIAVSYRKEIMPKINEKNILIMTLFFIYIALRYLESVGVLLLVLFFLPIIATFVLAFTTTKLNSIFKFLFYLWFLIINCILLFSQFSVGSLSFFFKGAPSAGFFEIFFAGMIFVILCINVWYIIELMPIPGKHQSFMDRLDEVKESISGMVKKYSSDQLRFSHSLQIIIFFVALISVNAFFRLNMDFLFLNLFLIAANIFFPTYTLKSTSK
jgi:hypothetical protein